MSMILGVPFDQIYQEDQGDVPDFVFNEEVAQVFQNMIQRSVPGYGLTLEMIGVIAQKAFGAQKGRAYDLGCSLGASLLPILKNTEAEVIGVDNSSEMLNQAENILSKELNEAQQQRVSLLHEDVLNVDYEKSRLFISNFTLQFIQIEQRRNLLSKAYRALEAGGMMLISEKVVHTEPSVNNELIELHHTFKKLKGYSELEISQKRDAIDNVLLPESVDTHLSRLKEVGFSQAFVWFQTFNFVSILALK